MTSNLANKAQKLLDPTTKLPISPRPTGGQGLALTADGRIPNGAAVYQTYTPVWTGSVSNPVIGNGTLTGRWTKIGRLVSGYVHMIAGSTTTFGSGTYIFTAPVTPYTTVVNQPMIGSGIVFQSSTSDLWTVTSYVVGATFELFVTATASAYAVSSTQPFTFASSNDQVRFCFTYEAAQ